MTTLLVLLYFTVACAQLAALFAILFRYAIPRSPGFFHLLCVPSLLAGVVALFALGFLTLLPPATLFLGLDSLGWRVTFLASQLVTWGALDLYAVYHAYRVRNERQEREIQEQSAMLEALEKAEIDREERAVEVKQTLKEETEAVRTRLEAAGAVIREDAESVKQTLKEETKDVKASLEKAREQEQEDARHVRVKLDAAEEQLREEAESLHRKIDALEARMDRTLTLLESKQNGNE